MQIQILFGKNGKAELGPKARLNMFLDYIMSYVFVLDQALKDRLTFFKFVLMHNKSSKLNNKICRLSVPSSPTCSSFF